MKKIPKAQKFVNYANAVKAINEGRPLRSYGTKDGSIATHPVVSVPSFSERVVLKDCMKWLKRNNVLCNRNNVGTGVIGESGIYSYGIKGAGDIIGLLPTGQHFEIETKAGKGGRLSLQQQKRMKKIEENNGLYFVIHGISELEYFMGELL